MGVLAFYTLEAGAAAQHTVELLYHLVDRLVEVFSSSAADMIISPDFKMPFGNEFLLV